MLPVVRTVNSLPAGIGKMKLNKFITYTFIGSIPWNFALTYVGILLGKNWNLISNYSHIIDIFVISILLVGIFWFVYKHRKKK
jgi:membrane protein DedA with SNARE-associated domain